MAERRRDVVFRRIRGRIVPIRIKKQKQDALVAFGALTSGTFLSLKGGRLSGVTAKGAIATKQLAFSFPKDFGTDALIPGQGAFKKSQRLAALAPKIAGFSKLFGAALIGLGVEKGVSALGIEETLGVEALSEVGGVAAATLVAAGAQKGLTGKKLRTQALAGARKFATTSNLRKALAVLSKGRL